MREHKYNFNIGRDNEKPRSNLETVKKNLHSLVVCQHEYTDNAGDCRFLVCMSHLSHYMGLEKSYFQVKQETAHLWYDLSRRCKHRIFLLYYHL